MPATALALIMWFQQDLLQQLQLMFPSELRFKQRTALKQPLAPKGVQHDMQCGIDIKVLKTLFMVSLSYTIDSKEG